MMFFLTQGRELLCSFDDAFIEVPCSSLITSVTVAEGGAGAILCAHTIKEVIDVMVSWCILRVK